MAEYWEKSRTRRYARIALALSVVNFVGLLICLYFYLSLWI